MDIYQIIFLNSLQSSLLISFRSENAWFAAIEFGECNVLLATLAAIIGSFAGNCLSFIIGYYLAKKRNNWFDIDEGIYKKISYYFRYARFLLLLPFPFTPVIGQFVGLFIALNGFFRNKIITSLAIILVGRIIFYSYYLFLSNYNI